MVPKLFKPLVSKILKAFQSSFIIQTKAEDIFPSIVLQLHICHENLKNVVVSDILMLSFVVVVDTFVACRRLENVERKTFSCVVENCIIYLFPAKRF